MPLLSPQVIGKKQPFPFLKNKEIYAQLLCLEQKWKSLELSINNEVFERLIKVPSGKRALYAGGRTDPSFSATGV